MYPLIKAMRECYSGRYAMEETTFADAGRKPDLRESVCWHMMGLYRESLPAAVTIHDYRSLSLGRLGWLKDRLKEKVNAKPDLRLIQPSIANRMKFADIVPTILLDVAISDAVLEYRKIDPDDYVYDFCYVGSMKRERRLERMIDSFLRHVSPSKKLLLIGRPEFYLVKRYAGAGNVIFTGPLHQREAFKTVAQANVAVSYFPDHFPHIYQTPTKLLEYGAIGGRILSNDQSMNLAKCKEYGIRSAWGPTKDLFASIPEKNADWPTNMSVDVNPMLFSAHMEASGLLQRLDA